MPRPQSGQSRRRPLDPMSVLAVAPHFLILSFPSSTWQFFFACQRTEKTPAPKFAHSVPAFPFTTSG